MLEFKNKYLMVVFFREFEQRVPRPCRGELEAKAERGGVHTRQPAEDAPGGGKGEGQTGPLEGECFQIFFFVVDRKISLSSKKSSLGRWETERKNGKLDPWKVGNCRKCRFFLEKIEYF